MDCFSARVCPIGTRPLHTVQEMSLKKSFKFSANGEIPFKKSRRMFYFSSSKPLTSMDCGIHFQIKTSRPICSHVNMSYMWTKYLSQIFKKDLVSEVDRPCRMTPLIRELPAGLHQWSIYASALALVGVLMQANRGVWCILQHTSLVAFCLKSISLLCPCNSLV